MKGTLCIIICLLHLIFTDASNAFQYPLSVPKLKNIGGKTDLLSLRGGSLSSSAVAQVDWRFFLAGGVCAACSHGITTPIDVVKTKMQTEPTKYNQGILKAAASIIKTEGVLFLLAGLGPTIIGYGIEGALKFGLYESLKPLLSKLTSHEFINFLFASIVAGAFASVVLCPIEDTRIRMVGDSRYAKDNAVTAMVRIVREEGIAPLFSGLIAMLLKQVPYTMAKQVSFDFFAKLLYAFAERNNLKVKEMRLVMSMAAALPASVLSCVFSQPGDMLLTAVVQSHGKKTTASVISELYKEYGLKGFFLGLRARLVHVAVIITTQLVIYDIVKQACGLAPTGSH